MSWGDLFTRIFDSSFASRWSGECSGWSKELIWLHVIADLGIWVAYMVIPMMLIRIAKTRKDVPFNFFFFMFAMFIVGCGLTHLMGAIVPFLPVYYLDFWVKFVTALVSLLTAYVLFKELPQIISFPNPFEARHLLEAQKKELADIFMAMPHPTILVDKAGQILLMSDQLSHFGYARGELLGKSIDVLVPEWLRPRHPSLRASFFVDPKLFSIGITQDVYIVCKNGKQRAVEITLNPVEGRSDVVLVSILDVTQRKEFEKQIRDKEQELSSILEAIPDTIVIVNKSGLILSANSQITPLFGYLDEEIVGKPLEVLLPDRFRNKHRVYLQRFFLNPKPRLIAINTELVGLHKNGDEIPLEIRLNPLVSSKNGPICIASVRDISERKYEKIIKDRNLELEQINKELENFAFIAAHDLQDPLKQNRVLWQFLIDKIKPSDEDIKGYFESIRKNNQRMQDLVKNLLSFARQGKDPIALETVNLKIVLDDVLRGVGKSGASFDIKQLPTVRCDSIQIGRIFQNLIQNSVKYKSERPLIIEIGHKEIDGKFEIYVKDNGIGIPAGKIPLLFNIYHRVTESEKGVGFGLAICRKIIDKHGGAIWVESKEGEGSTFYFTLLKTPE